MERILGSGRFAVSWRWWVVVLLLVFWGLGGLGGLFASPSEADLAEDSGGPLRVGVRVAEPFAYQDFEGEWRGIAVELWRRIADGAGYTYTFEGMDLNGVLAAAEWGEVDVGIGALSILLEREELMDFTHAFMTSGLGIAARAEPAGLLAAVQRLFSLEFLRVIAALFAVLLFFGFLIWLFERRGNEQFGGSTLEGIGSGFWWSAVTMTTVGYGDKAPLSLPGRLVALIWMFGAIIIISGFTAAIASSLTVGSLQSKVRGLEDLSNVRVAVVEGSTSAFFLRGRGVSFQGVSDLGVAMRGLEDGRFHAVVHDRPILQHHIRENDLPGIAVLPDQFERQLYGFALPLESPLRKDINIAMLEVTNSEAWHSTVESYLGRNP